MLFRRGNRKKSAGARSGGTVDDREQVRPKSIMKGARFADVAAIQERMTAILHSITKEAFADSFQKFMNVANNVL
jgi:hypothetical protein